MADSLDNSEGPSRIAGFSDAVFAIAATLLVLDLKLPNGTRPSQLVRALRDMDAQIFAYALSFAVIATFWVTHHRTFSRVRRVDHTFLVLNLILLALIAVIPFPTAVLGGYGNEAPAVILYAGTIGLAAVASTAVFVYASAGRRLIDPATPLSYIHHAWLRGIVIAAVFLGSIPIALVNVDAAKYFWITVLVARIAVRRRFGSINRPVSGSA